MTAAAAAAAAAAVITDTELNVCLSVM